MFHCNVTKERENVSMIAAGEGCVAYIDKDGSLWYTTDTDPYKITKIIDSDVSSVSCDVRQLLAIKNDRSAWFYGGYAGVYGDLRPPGVERTAREAFVVMDHVIDVSPQYNRALVVDENGALWGWEKDPLLLNTDQRQHVKLIEGVEKVSQAYAAIAVIRKDGNLWVFGDPDYGNNVGTSMYQSEPVKILDNVVDVDMDGKMALKADGTLWAWGDQPPYTYPDDPHNKVPHPVPEKIMDGVAIPGTPAHFPSPWAKDEVSQAESAGFVPTALQSRYQQSITRAEFCALAVSLYEITAGKEIKERQTFADTADVNVEKAAAIGVVYGVGNHQFAPNDLLTREQAATMLSRLADAIGKPLAAQTPAFADNAHVSPWAASAVGQMQASGIMGGVGHNAFAPKRSYTREQSIVTIMRLAS
jgi:hypothetical protein